jgi:hypothetical protein
MASRRLSEASLEPFGTRVLIEAVRLSFFHGMHVEKLWHSDCAAVSKIRCFAALQMLRSPFLEVSRSRLNSSSRSGTVSEVKPSDPSKPLAGGRLKRALSYSNADDKPWQTAALNGTQRIQPAISERGAAIC